MTFLADAAEIRGLFKTGFEAAQPGVSYWFDGQKAEPPEGEIWVRLFVIPGDSPRLSVGTPVVYRNLGMVMAQIFQPLTDEFPGDGYVMDVADAIAGILKEQVITTVRLRTPALRRVGNDGNGYYQVNVVVPYDATHTRT